MSVGAVALALALAVAAQAPPPVVDGAPAPSLAPRAEVPPAPLDPAEPAPLDPAAIEGEPAVDVPSAPQGEGAAFDAAGEAKLQDCLAAIAQRRELEARACLQALIDGAPGTLPAARAGSALAVLDAQAIAQGGDADDEGDDVDDAATVALIPAGRLGITTAAGLFGVWNGVAAGLITQITAPSLNPGITLIGTGVLAVGLGATYAIGGYLLAEHLQLGEGPARLVASGLVWGTNAGIGAAFIAADAVMTSTSQGTAAIDAALLTVVLGGYAGAGAALGAAMLMDFDEAQVSLINTGGWIGSLLGLLLLPNYATFVPSYGPGTLAFYGATYAVMNTVGLVGGGVAGRFLHLTWGEALLADLGGVAGVVLGGALSLGVVATTGSSLGQASVPFVTGSVALGALGGAVGAVGVAMVWRNMRGAPLLRGEPDGLHATVGAVGAVIDKAGQVVPTAPILALAW